MLSNRILLKSNFWYHISAKISVLDEICTRVMLVSLSYVVMGHEAFLQSSILWLMEKVQNSQHFLNYKC